MSNGIGTAGLRHRLWRFVELLLCITLLASMASGAIVHAAEAQCADEATVSSHDTARADTPSPVDAPAEKATHAAHACHGHHAAVAEISGAVQGQEALVGAKVVLTTVPLAGALAQRLLRPPIA